jgi:hypothetical protein
MAKEIDPGSVGQEKEHKTPNEADESANGRYEDEVHSIPMERRTQEGIAPKAPDPNPFRLGPMAK